MFLKEMPLRPNLSAWEGVGREVSPNGKTFLWEASHRLKVVGKAGVGEGEAEDFMPEISKRPRP